ncbi:MAG TPA: HAD family hydrolase [Chitinophagaceae bacterium]
MRKMVVLDLDNIVLQGKFIDACAKKYNFKQALALLRGIDKNTLSLARRTASFLTGKSVYDLKKIADDLSIVHDIPEVIKELKQRKYVVGIISDSYDVITRHIAEKIDADFDLSYELKHIEEIVTGEVNIPAFFNYSENSSCDHPVCKTNALRHVCAQYDVSIKNCIVVGDNESDLCMIRHAGVGVTFCSSSEHLRNVARKNITKPALGELLEYAH